MSGVSTREGAPASAESPSAGPALPRYITIKEAAESLDTKIWTIHQRVSEGKLSAVDHDGVWLVSAQEVEQLDGVVPQGRACLPATPEVFRALELPLRVINEARGTDHTLKSLAADACGLDVFHVDELTLADTDAMASYIGSILLAGESSATARD